MRRTIVAFVLGAVLFGAPVVMAATTTYGNGLGSGLDFYDDGQVDLVNPLGHAIQFLTDGSARVKAGGSEELILGPDGFAQLSAGGALVQLVDGYVFLNLPTSDPHVAGALYVTSNGTVKVSAG